MGKYTFTEKEYERILFWIESGENFIRNNKTFFINLLEMQVVPIKKNKAEFLVEYRDSYSMLNHSFRHLFYFKRKIFTENLYFLYLPLARKIYEQSMEKNKPIIVGIQAHQGTGKTTLCNILIHLLKNTYHLNTIAISIDDIYLTRNELNELRNRDKDFKYRGPPGTHDLELSLELFNSIKKNEDNIKIPRFHKSDESRSFETILKPIDVLLFEGWFVGAMPLDDKAFENTAYKNNSLMRKCNDKLKEYVILWDYLDSIIVIKPENYQYSKKWRMEAEKPLQRQKKGMKYHTLVDFIDYFWKALPPNAYFEPLLHNPKTVFSLTIDQNRNVLSINHHKH